MNKSKAVVSTILLVVVLLALTILSFTTKIKGTDISLYFIVFSAIGVSKACDMVAKFYRWLRKQ